MTFNFPHAIVDYQFDMQHPTDAELLQDADTGALVVSRDSRTYFVSRNAYSPEEFDIPPSVHDASVIGFDAVRTINVAFDPADRWMGFGCALVNHVRYRAVRNSIIGASDLEFF